MGTFSSSLVIYLCSFEPESHRVSQTGLELIIFLPQLPECWGYRCVPPHLTLVCPLAGPIISDLAHDL
jgi:hypothetical protein